MIKWVLYLDMDGVLSDLEGAVAEYGGVQIEALKDNDLRNSLIKERIALIGPDHWTSLKPINLELWKATIAKLSDRVRIEILTSYGDQTVSDCGVEAHYGKVLWVQKTFQEEWESGEIASFNGVQFCEQKRFYATPYSFLIDDQKNTTSGFREEGGHAFLYRSDLHSEVESWVLSKMEGFIDPVPPPG